MLKFICEHLWSMIRGARGSVWGSVSCPGTLWEANQGIWTSDLPVTRRWLYPPRLVTLHKLVTKVIKKCIVWSKVAHVSHRCLITFTTVAVCFHPRPFVGWFVSRITQQRGFKSDRETKPSQKADAFVRKEKQSSYPLDANTNMFVSLPLLYGERRRADKTTWPGVPLLCFCRVVINSEDVVRLKQLGRSAGRHAQIHLSAERGGEGDG